MGRTALAAIMTLFALAISSASTWAAVDKKRVALVIANSTYQNTTQLKNPANDGRDMSAVLRRLKFNVIEGFDLDHEGMRSKIREFTGAIDGADVALFYYAGHGLQVAGKNYLAPINAKLEKESDLDFETVQLNLVLRQMEREQRTNLVFLDACRDNPLTQRLARSMSATRSAAIGRGLARVESGVGMLISYATSPGMVALDGQGRNSPYTKALVKHIEKPGVGISDLMIKVRQDVLATSKGKQVPWEHSSLTGNFVFKEKVKTAALAKPAPKVAAPAAQITSTVQGYREIDRERIVSAAFQATVSVGTCGAYKAFEEQHRGTFYARLASEWIETNCKKTGRAITVEKAVEPVKETVAAPVASTPTPDASKVVTSTAPVADKKDVKVAATNATPVVTPQEVAPLTGRTLVLAVQKELNRVGCSAGRPDGKWGRQSTRAMRNFNRYAKLSLATGNAGNDALTILKSKTGRVCPLVCGAQYLAKGDRCVKKTCPAGRVLSRKGSCVIVAKKAPRKAAPKKRPTVQRKAPKKSPKQDQFWGGEDSRVDCERGVFTDKCFGPR